MGNSAHLGLFILRVGIGIMFIFHGYPKLTGGQETWTTIGTMGLAPLGIDNIPMFFGLLAGLAEAGGGLCLITGIFFRPASLILAVTMLIATNMHLSRGDSFNDYSHAAEAAIIFISLALIGPGKYSFWGRSCVTAKSKITANEST